MRFFLMIKQCIIYSQILENQINSLHQNYISQEETEIAKRHVAGEETISSEDMDYVMKRLFRNMEMHFPLRNTDDTIKIIESITKTDVMNSIDKLLKPENRAFVMYGPSVKRSSSDRIKNILK